MVKKIIKFYQQTISRWLEYLFGKGCRFQPTCSEYTLSALEKYGNGKGMLLSLKRISRCHPFSKGGFDPVI